MRNNKICEIPVYFSPSQTSFHVVRLMFAIRIERTIE